MKIFMARVVTLVGFAEGHSKHSTFSHRSGLAMATAFGREPLPTWDFSTAKSEMTLRSAVLVMAHIFLLSGCSRNTMSADSIHINIYIKSPNVLLAALGSFMNHEWMDEESTSGLKTGRVEFGFCIFPYQNTILMTGTCHESLAHDFNTNQPYRPAINSWFLRKHPVEFEKGIEAWRSLWVKLLWNSM